MIRTLLRPNVTHFTIVLSQADNNQLHNVYFLFEEISPWIKIALSLQCRIFHPRHLGSILVLFCLNQLTIHTALGLEAALPPPFRNPPGTLWDLLTSLFGRGSESKGRGEV